MFHSSEAKSQRLLKIYARLVSGRVLSKSEIAKEFGVTNRSIQRDISALNAFIADEQLGCEIFFDRKKRGYCIRDSDIQSWHLSNSEIFAVCKILLESRSMTREEICPILDNLIDRCVPEKNRKFVFDMLANERHHYIAPHHGRTVLPLLWELGEAVQQRTVINIEYSKLKGKETVWRNIEPVGILFSEYYFYLAAYLRDVNHVDFANPNDSYPTIYRIDRIKALELTDEHFRPAYSARFQEGEFRKRVQFMYGGRLKTVRFIYTGLSIEAILDRLPTAVAEYNEEENHYLVTAEVFGDGIDMWLRSQGDAVKILE